MSRDNFEIIGTIQNVEIVAINYSIRDLRLLERMYGKGRWRKLKALLRSSSKMVGYVRLNSIGTKRTALANAR
jgi:hypothetical protein